MPTIPRKRIKTLKQMEDLDLKKIPNKPIPILDDEEFNEELDGTEFMDTYDKFKEGDKD